MPTNSTPSLIISKFRLCCFAHLQSLAPQLPSICPNSDFPRGGPVRAHRDPVSDAVDRLGALRPNAVGQSRIFSIARTL